MVFERELLRLGGDAPALSFSSHLIGHADCYRPALAFLVDEFPDFFLPPIGDEAATSFEGAIFCWPRLHLACISPASRLHLALDGPHSVIFDSVTRSPAPSYPLTDRLGRSPLPHPPYSPRCLSPAGLGSYSWTNPTLELFNTSHAHAVG